jgi:hypothetical protein
MSVTFHRKLILRMKTGNTLNLFVSDCAERPVSISSQVDAADANRAFQIVAGEMRERRKKTDRIQSNQCADNWVVVLAST